MKTTKLLTFITIVILAVSCKKDNNPGGSSGENILTMKVNGVNWVADDNLFGYRFTSNNFVNISGKVNSANDYLTIGNFAIPNTGTFNISPTLFNGISYVKGGASPKTYKIISTIPNSRATLVVTKINDATSITENLEGTFSGVLHASTTDSVVITNGVFKFN